MSEIRGGDLRPVDPITVYSKPSCVQCTATYRALDSEGLQYNVVDLSEDPQAMQRVKDLGYMQAPVVVSGDKHWSGFRPDQVKVLTSAAHVAGIAEYHDRVLQLFDQRWISYSAMTRLTEVNLMNTAVADVKQKVDLLLEAEDLPEPARLYLSESAGAVAGGPAPMTWIECADRAQVPEAVMVGSPDPPAYAAQMSLQPTH